MRQGSNFNPTNQAMGYTLKPNAKKPFNPKLTVKNKQLPPHNEKQTTKQTQQKQRPNRQ
jgi:hypothetical protein